MPTISIRIDEAVLRRVDAQAGKLGITRTALLLSPWLKPKGVSAEKVVEPEPAAAPPVNAAPRKPTLADRILGRTLKGWDPITHEPIYK